MLRFGVSRLYLRRWVVPYSLQGNFMRQTNVGAGIDSQILFERDHGSSVCDGDVTVSLPALAMALP